MSKFNIDSLEQRAMFLAQTAAESDDLTAWAEQRSRSSAINLYWIHRFTQFAAVAGAKYTVTATGIVFQVAASAKKPPATEAIDLEWAPGDLKHQASSAGASDPFASVDFTKVGQYYTYTFTGAVPLDYGDLQVYPHLLVVDHATGRVLFDLVNRLGNWSPDDAYNFRGGGPIQLTGRHNYQAFADYEKAPQLMTTTNGKTPVEQLADTANPTLGLDAAGWYWSVYAGNLNAKTDSYAWQQVQPFALAISIAINGKNKSTGLPNGYPHPRLDNYLRIRSELLDKDL
jgi:predicted chitinase